MENLRITESIQQNLLSATKWLKFFTVTGTFGMVLIALSGIVFLFIPNYNGVNGMVLSLAYFAICALYFYPIKKCYSIIAHTRKALSDDSQEALECCADNVHSVLKYYGILTIAVIALYILGIGAAFIMGISRMLKFMYH